jgi:hypothetical protein
MDEKKNSIADYFSAPKDYCWQWTEKGEVIDWHTDLTICYTDELIGILEEMSDQGWPPLGSILLVLIACKEEGKHILPATKIMEVFLLDIRAENDALYQQQLLHLQQVKKLLGIIAKLPLEYRSGKKRALLLKTIFTGIPPVVSSIKTRTLLHFFYKNIFINKQQDYTQLAAELAPLAIAAQEVNDKDALELKLRTSLEILPDALPVALTDLPVPDLFTQLTADNETAGIGRMAKRILATLYIPVHTQHSNEQPLGGISDISSKGSYDRLLISELAQDDQVLIARVANNEALYFKREAQAVQPEKDKVILVDVSLKMWGIPRLFAISAALACIQYDEKRTNVNTYTLHGTTFKRADLSSKKGVIQAMSVLDHHLHSATALEAALQSENQEKSTCFLITAEELMQQTEFRQTVVRLQAKLSYLITVNRNGQFRLFQYNKGQKKLCSAAILNPEELLFNPATTPVKSDVSLPEQLPEILRRNPLPLRFPASRLKRLTNNNALLPSQGVVCITSDQRMLYWQDKTKGAIELCGFIEKGNYSFGADDPSQVYVLINNPNREHIYLHIFSTSDTGYAMYNTYLSTGDCNIIYLNKYFHIQHASGLHAICGATGETTAPISLPVFNKNFTATALASQQNLNSVFRFINKGYNTISRIEAIYTNDAGKLVIGNRYLQVDHYRRLKLSTSTMEINKEKLRSIVISSFPHPANPNIIFTQFACPGGVTAIADSRGLLHLQTDDQSLPEVTLTMITDILLTGWVSDDTYCGNSYFMHDAPAAAIMEPALFYTHYIEPYIERLKWK